MIIKNGLFTTKYTCVECEDEKDQKFGAPHHFKVKKIDPVTLQPTEEVVAEVNLQEGPIKEFGINGCSNEDLLLMVLTRLQGFQNGPFACRENAIAITKLEESVMWLRKRTTDREAKGIEGTSKVK